MEGHDGRKMNSPIVIRAKNDEIASALVKQHKLFMNSIDGHFWVERDGKIIDPIFKENIEWCEEMGCCSKRKYVKCADDLLGKIFIIQFMFCFDLEVKTYEKAKKAGCQVAHDTGYGYCFHNACAEIYKNGGTLCFGSLLFKNKHNNDYKIRYGEVNSINNACDYIIYGKKHPVEDTYYSNKK